jgi:hypothetical protein
VKTHLDFSGRRFSVATRSRRRVLVVLMYFVAATLVLAWTGGLMQFTPCFLAFSAWMIVFRLIFGGDPNGGLTEPSERNDEREMVRRDHAHYVAYRFMSSVLVAALFCAWFNGSNPATPAVRSFLQHLPYGVLFAGIVLYFTLPQAILLWTEPDLEVSQ